MAEITAATVKELPVAKIMRWGSGEAEFVRPVHGLILLHGNAVVPGEVLGLTRGNRSRGHRFLGDGELAVSHPDDYARLLEQRGEVVPGFVSSPQRDAADTTAIADYNQRISTDPRLTTTIVPLRDGVSISVKRGDQS